MSIFNHFGISNLYFSTVNKKSVHLFYAHDCVVFMDALNVVAKARVLKTYLTWIIPGIPWSSLLYTFCKGPHNLRMHIVYFFRI